MNWLDFVILGVIGLSALISLVRGFAKEAMSLVIWFGAFFIASQYYAKLAVYFTNIEERCSEMVPQLLPYLLPH